MATQNNSLHDESDGKQIENYRLSKIQEVEADLNTDVKNHLRSFTKYKKLSKIVEISLHVCNLVNVLSAGGVVGSSGVGLLPAVLPCATIAGLTTLLNSSLQMANKKINTKKNKQCEIALLAQRVKRQFLTLISRVADDNAIGANEFEEVMSLITSYHEQKQQLVSMKKKI